MDYAATNITWEDPAHIDRSLDLRFQTRRRIKGNMQIRVKCNCGEGYCSEWAIVELQGVVEAQPSFQDRLQNLEIGTLCRPSSQEVYTFTVGYHELTGSKIPLKKPILVLTKIKHSDVDNSCESNCNVELEVIGIIRHRILFKARPKALISKPQVAGREKQTSIMLGCVPSEQSA